MSSRGPYRLRLYVAGDTPGSATAVANLKAICTSHLPGRHEIEVIDVFREPTRALADRILTTPALVKLAPAPVRRVVGPLTDVTTVLQALGLEAASI